MSSNLQYFFQISHDHDISSSEYVTRSWANLTVGVFRYFQFLFKKRILYLKKYRDVYLANIRFEKWIFFNRKKNIYDT